MEKEGPFVWLNCEWLPAHHYQRKSIPEKKKIIIIKNLKLKKKIKRKKLENQKHTVFMGICTVGAKQLTHQNYNKQRAWSEKFSL